MTKKATAVSASMKVSLILTVAKPAANASTTNDSGTLARVQSVGVKKCRISTGFLGFSKSNTKDKWENIDVEFYRAVASAVLESLNYVEN